MREEIREEGQVRHLDAFARFIDIAAICGGESVNISGISRDAGIGRNSTQGYFDILVDTIMGRWLQAYRPRAKVREIGHPKFYWFDVGAMRSAAGGFRNPLLRDWKGKALETLIHNELIAYMEYRKIGGDLSNWRTKSGTEVDFVWKYGDKHVLIESKAVDSSGRIKS